MENKTIKVLLIEDNSDDVELIKRKLGRSVNARFSITPARNLNDGLEHLTHNETDLILSDLGLPDSHGLDTVTKILCAAPHIPLIILSGFDDEATAIKAVQTGAQDYLVKGQLEDIQIERSLSYAIERNRLQRELEQHTQEIYSIQSNLLKILEKNADAIIVVGEDRNILFTNPAAKTLLGRKGKYLIDKPFDYPLDIKNTSEIKIERHGGNNTVAEINVVEIDWEGKPAYLASLRDITERKRAEQVIRESEAKFSKAFHSSANLFAINKLKDGKFIEVNDAFTHMTGYTREEAIGHNANDLNIWGSEEIHARIVKKTRENKKVRNEEITIRSKSGEIRTGLFSCEQITVGGEECFINTITDITELKQAEDALRESGDKFSKAFRHSPEVIVITGLRNGNMLEVNDTFLRLTGYTSEEIIGKKSAELGIWANIEDRNLMTTMLKEKGIVSNEEYQFKMKSGEIRTWLFSAEIINIDNEPCILSVTTDITERKKAEEALRFSDAAFKSIHESVIAMDTDFTITQWNNISEQIYGIKASRAIGKKLLDIIEIVETLPGENAGRFKTLEDNGYYQEEQLHRTKDGEVWVNVSLQAIEDAGERHGWVALASVITQRKLAEEALKRSEEKYRELISGSIDGIISADSQMRVIIWNQGAERIFGYKEKEMLGQNILKIIPEELQKGVSKGIVHIVRTDKSRVADKILDTVGLNKDGSRVPIELSVSSRKAEDTYITTAIIRDITERKETEEKLRKIDEMKSEFLSNVSHELRTPLQSISGFTKLILSGKVPDSATQQEFLQIIDRETVHLGNLINSLLDMSRLESGRFQINKQLMPIRDVILDSVMSFHTLARDKDISLSEDIPAQLPEMEIDGERFRQVVINLLSNAIKYSDPGGSVTIKVENHDNELLFLVSDRGVGMSEESLHHLFERFFRAEDKLARGGTGLGLYITKQIIEAHGGQIWAESKLDEGSTFSFTLPLYNKGGNGHDKENSGHRRRPGYLKTGGLYTQA